MRLINLPASAGLFFLLNLPLSAQECKKGCTAGEITAGQPRIWRYDRVYPLIDGMLRDVEAIRLKSMADVDPNETNNVAITILQTLARVSGSYDQSIGVNNASVTQKQDRSDQDFAQKRSEEAKAQEDWDTQHKSLVADRTALEDSLRTSQATRSGLMETYLKSIGTATEDNANKAYSAAKERSDDLSRQLTEKNAQISTAGLRPVLTPFNAGSGSLQVGDSSGVLGSTGLNSGTLNSGLSGLPSELKNKLLAAATNTPTLPATKRIDNQMTVLYERMARELSVLNDDASRDGKKVYLMGFDVGLNPTKAEKNKIAQVSYTLTGNGECAKPYVTQIYPAVSAYNVATFKAETHAWVLAGIFKSLIGLGVSADYQRLKEQVTSGLSQSVYTSGFGSGTPQFGWRFAPAPGDPLVTPGERSVFAFVVVGEKCQNKQPNTEALGNVNSLEKEKDELKLGIERTWQNRTGGKIANPQNKNGWGEPAKTEEPAKTAAAKIPAMVEGALTLPSESKGIKVKSIAYDPITYDGKDVPAFGSVAVALKEDIAPDMLVTVGGRALPRVRDWRGRATKPSFSDEYFSNSALTGLGTVSLLRGILETDNLQPDSWMAVNSRTLVINVKTDPASLLFPAIRLHAAGTSRELTDLRSVDDLRVGDVVLEPKGDQSVFNTAFLPLTSRMSPAGNFIVSLWKSTSDNSLDAAKNVKVLRLQVVEKGGLARHLPIGSRVLLIDRTPEEQQIVKAWTLACRTNVDDLLCTLPSTPQPESAHAFTVRISAPGIVEDAVDFDMKRSKVNPYFAEQKVRPTRGGWEISLTRQNREADPQAGATPAPPTSQSPDDCKQIDAQNKWLVVCSIMIEGTPLSFEPTQSRIKFTIPYSEVENLHDSDPITQGGVDVGSLSNLRTVLLPQFQSAEVEGNRVYIRGSQFSPILNLYVGVQRIDREDVQYNDETLSFQIPKQAGLISYRLGDPRYPNRAANSKVIPLIYPRTNKVLRVRKVDGQQDEYELTGYEVTEAAAAGGRGKEAPATVGAGQKVTATATVSIDGKEAAKANLASERAGASADKAQSTSEKKGAPAAPAVAENAAIAGPGAAPLPASPPAPTEGMVPSGKTDSGLQKYALPIQNMPPLNH